MQPRNREGIPGRVIILLGAIAVEAVPLVLALATWLVSGRWGLCDNRLRCE